MTVSFALAQIMLSDEIRENLDNQIKKIINCFDFSQIKIGIFKNTFDVSEFQYVQIAQQKIVWEEIAKLSINFIVDYEYNRQFTFKNRYDTDEYKKRLEILGFVFEKSRWKSVRKPNVGDVQENMFMYFLYRLIEDKMTLNAVNDQNNENERRHLGLNLGTENSDGQRGALSIDGKIEGKKNVVVEDTVIGGSDATKNTLSSDTPQSCQGSDVNTVKCSFCDYDNAEVNKTCVACNGELNGIIATRNSHMEERDGWSRMLVGGGDIIDRCDLVIDSCDNMFGEEGTNNNINTYQNGMTGEHESKNSVTMTDVGDVCREENNTKRQEEDNDEWKQGNDSDKWKCGRCGLFNEYVSIICEACEELYKKGRWTCGHCTMGNSCANDACETCGERNDNIKLIDTVMIKRDSNYQDGCNVASDKRGMVYTKPFSGDNYKAASIEYPLETVRTQVETKVCLKKADNMDKWKCGRCGLCNEYVSIICDACEELYKEGTWTCGHCTMWNSCANDACDICGEWNKYCHNCKINRVPLTEVRCCECSKNENIGWRCPYRSCGTGNNGTDEYCGKCKLWRHNSQIRGATGKQLHEGKERNIWVCQKCDTANELSGRRCSKWLCNGSRYEKIQCYYCYAYNNGSSDICSKCSKPLR